MVGSAPRRRKVFTTFPFATGTFSAARTRVRTPLRFGISESERIQLFKCLYYACKHFRVNTGVSDEKSVDSPTSYERTCVLWFNRCAVNNLHTSRAFARNKLTQDFSYVEHNLHEVLWLNRKLVTLPYRPNRFIGHHHIKKVFCRNARKRRSNLRAEMCKIFCICIALLFTDTKDRSDAVDECTLPLSRICASVSPRARRSECPIRA